MISGVNIPGYFSTIAAILLLGGIQLISIGVVGEYIGRIYYEVKARLNILFKLQIFQVLKMMRRIPIKFTLNKKEALINESFFLVFAFYFINKSDYDVMSNLCNVTVIVVPTSISLLTLIFALFCCASSLAIYKPNPEPPVLYYESFLL